MADDIGTLSDKRAIKTEKCLKGNNHELEELQKMIMTNNKSFERMADKQKQMEKILYEIQNTKI